MFASKVRRIAVGRCRLQRAQCGCAGSKIPSSRRSPRRQRCAHTVAAQVGADLPPWGPAVVMVEEEGGPYKLDAGDKLRVFVYGQPNLSRLYQVDSEGRIFVPLIGEVSVRGSTQRASPATSPSGSAHSSSRILR